MLAKLMTVLSSAKGATAAVVIVAAAGTGVVATNTDLQKAITGTTTQTQTECARSTPTGQPVVVGVRNDADQTIRDAFQKDQTKLEQLRSTSVDPSQRAALADALKDGDAKLRAFRDKGLDDVAALTLGRVGRVAADPSYTPRPDASPCDRGANYALSTADADQVKVVVKAAVDNMDGVIAALNTSVAKLSTAAPKAAEHATPTPHATPTSH